MSIPCRLCGSERNDTEYSIGDHSILKCADCGFVHSSPLPSESVIHNIYKNSYFDSSRDLGYPDYKENKKIRVKTFEYYYSLIAPFLKNKNSALDIGCADASFLDILHANGFQKKEGIELNDEMFEEAVKKFIIHKEPIEKTGIKTKYDLITLFDVFEHIPDLKAAISNIHLLLKEDGLLVILTPDYGSLQRKINGKSWFQFKPKEHINYFTAERLQQFLSDNGFDVLYQEKGMSVVDRAFINNRLSKYGYRFISLLFSLFGKLLFINKEYIKVGNASVLMIAKRA